jgi:hypothetical protein
MSSTATAPGKAGNLCANIGAFEGCAGIDLPGRETLSQRTPWNETYSQLFAGRQHLRFGVSRPKGVFALEGIDGLNRVRSPNRQSTHIGEAVTMTRRACIL